VKSFQQARRSIEEHCNIPVWQWSVGTGGQRSLAAAVHRNTRHFTAPTGAEVLQTSKRASPGVLTPPITCIVATPYLGVYAHRYGHILCVECEFACTIPISEVPNLGANTRPGGVQFCATGGVCRSVRSKNTTPTSGVWHSYRGFFAFACPMGGTPAVLSHFSVNNVYSPEDLVLSSTLIPRVFWYHFAPFDEFRLIDMSCKSSFRNDLYLNILFLLWFCAHFLS